jgi:hypothetical protein
LLVEKKRTKTTKSHYAKPLLAAGILAFFTKVQEKKIDAPKIIF